MNARTRAELDKLFDGSESIVVYPAAPEGKLTIQARNRAIVREFCEVLENGYIDAKGVLRKPLLVMC
jgi:type I restriction enzyme, R subunit